jgi:class 3 adenylate cyclase/energy-coupling factor transporter ATP-binding protein EcfA2
MSRSCTPYAWATVLCRLCSQENPEFARFCLACGASLLDGSLPRDERRIVSVIFVDLVGFTARAESLDPEEVRALLMPYHEGVRREIESFGGVVEKFIGDAVMGIFGAPLAHGDDAERAVRAALVLRDGVGGFAEGELQIRIAVNTGEAVVSLGARPALGESMVAGDVVNTAARLQAAAPVNGIVVGEQTYLETRDVIQYEETDSVVAKGKTRPVMAWIAVRPLTQAGERPLADWPMVGRMSEMAILCALWDRTLESRLPHLVSIFGPAGIGKSTLAAEFASIAVESGARVIRGRSLPYRESGTYGALATQVMQLCGGFESDSADVIDERLRARTAVVLADSDAQADVIAGHLGVIVGIDAGSGAADRDVLFSSVRQFLEAVAREQPTILVFEDIHWADANLLDLIETIAMRVHGLPLLLVTLARPELLDAREGWGGRLPGYTALHLRPLGEEHARELAIRRLGKDDRADEVIRVAEGNPLFIEQLSATMGETASCTLPTSIRGIVAARLDALPQRERALLLDAAVVGKVFWNDALCALNPDDPGLDRLLENLELRDLVRREPTSLIEGQQQFAFTHVLIRDVAYDLLARADRARRHTLVAEFFERSTGASGESSGALARHWRDAGEFERAVQQLARAAEQAERGWAKDHAALLYREALALIPEEDVERRSMLRRRLAIASTASFHLTDVRRPESPRA